MSLADLRQNYTRGELIESHVAGDPFAQFHAWFAEAQDAAIREPNAMTLATVDAHGQPAARIVLLKELDSSGFVFYTNYSSRKGQELAHQPRAALLFYWDVLERQVRIEGVVERVAPEQSDAYYRSRPIGSRIGAWASPQSAVVASRGALENAYQQYEQSLGEDPNRPPHWGGYRLRPQLLEFWQGRPSRLHDRIRYLNTPEGWTIDRLAP